MQTTTFQSQTLRFSLLLAVAVFFVLDTPSRAAEKWVETEREFISILKSDAPGDQKALACKKLAIYGTPQAVPVLAPLLANEQLTSWARIALEAIPGTAADDALRAALPGLTGRLLVGTINTIGVRRDPTLADYRGKTVLLIFWSTWCSRCSEELVFLRDHFGHHEDVPVLLINQDSEKMASRKRIVEMRDGLCLPFAVIMDTGLELWNLFGIRALPTSVVIGKDGRVVHAEANFYRETPEKLLKAVCPG